MGNKLGRNDPCWCGSGVKYKKCHLGREDQERMTTQDLLKGSRSIIGAQRVCLHPDANSGSCAGGIVKAHSIQRNGALSKIARDGHVYHIKPDLATLIASNGQFRAISVGIGLASTFTGFCNRHDTETFAPIERNPFTGTSQQCFLLGYRAACMELYKKQGTAGLENLMRQTDKGTDLSSQMWIQEISQFVGIGQNAGLADITAAKSSYDSILKSQDYSKADYYVVGLDATPEISCCGMMEPIFDFDGNLLQDLTDTDARCQEMAFAIIPTDTGGMAVFSWLHDPSGPVEQLISSIHRMPDTEIPHALVRFAFLSFENVYMSPDWWESRTKEDQLAILTMTRANADITLGVCDLSDNGLRVVDWNVTTRQTSLSLA